MVVMIWFSSRSAIPCFWSIKPRLSLLFCCSSPSSYDVFPRLPLCRVLLQFLSLLPSLWGKTLLRHLPLVGSTGPCRCGPLLGPRAMFHLWGNWASCKRLLPHPGSL